MIKPPSDRFDTHEATPSIIWFRRAHGSPFTINEALDGWQGGDVSEMDVQDMIAHACWAWMDELERLVNIAENGVHEKHRTAISELEFWQSKRKAKT